MTYINRQFIWSRKWASPFFERPQNQVLCNVCSETASTSPLSQQRALEAPRGPQRPPEGPQRPTGGRRRWWWRWGWGQTSGGWAGSLKPPATDPQLYGGPLISPHLAGLTLVDVCSVSGSIPLRRSFVSRAYRFLVCLSPGSFCSVLYLLFFQTCCVTVK